jgi:hypothetical protein
VDVYFCNVRCREEKFSELKSKAAYYNNSLKNKVSSHLFTYLREPETIFIDTRYTVMRYHEGRHSTVSLGRQSGFYRAGSTFAPPDTHFHFHSTQQR